MDKKVNIGLCGLGTVGQSLLQLLAEKEDLSEFFSLTSCATRRGITGLSDDSLKYIQALSGRDAEDVVGKDVIELAQRPDIDVVVELIGGVTTAFDIAVQTLQRGAVLVTANKALLAERGDELAEICRKHDAKLYAEASAAAGIPVVRTLSELLVGDEVEQISGILNGTCNYIISRMEEGLGYDQALLQAQELGFAEADPKLDVSGVDAVQKAQILSAVTFQTPLPASAYSVSGVESLEAVDLQMARDFGYSIRHIGRAIYNTSAETVAIGAHLGMVPTSHVLAAVKDETNAVVIKSKNLKQLTLIGPGAGGAATASAVASDLITAVLHRDYRVLLQAQINESPTHLSVLSLDGICEPHYLRVRLSDQVGVLAKISSIISQSGVNIDRFIQTEGQDGVALGVMLLSSCQQSQVDQITIEAKSAGLTLGDPLFIRVVD